MERDCSITVSLCAPIDLALLLAQGLNESARLYLGFLCSTVISNTGWQEIIRELERRLSGGPEADPQPQFSSKLLHYSNKKKGVDNCINLSRSMISYYIHHTSPVDTRYSALERKLNCPLQHKHHSSVSNFEMSHYRTMFHVYYYLMDEFTCIYIWLH